MLASGSVHHVGSWGHEPRRGAPTKLAAARVRGGSAPRKLRAALVRHGFAARKLLGAPVRLGVAWWGAGARFHLFAFYFDTAKLERVAMPVNVVFHVFSCDFPRIFFVVFHLYRFLFCLVFNFDLWSMMKK